MAESYTVFVFEVVKVKVMGIHALSLADAAQKAADMVANNRRELFTTNPSLEGVSYTEAADETAYTLAELVDSESGDDEPKASQWFSGTQRLDDLPTPEEALCSPLPDISPLPCSGPLSDIGPLLTSPNSAPTLSDRIP